MVVPHTATSHSSSTRARTANSVVWKETRAYELTSNVRFSWDKYQTKPFEHFLKTVGLNFKNSDLTPLLVQLNLDGYEDVENDDGDNVHSMIHAKVQRKLRSRADEMDEDILFAASMGSKQKMPSNKPDPAKKTTGNELSPYAYQSATGHEHDPVWDSFTAPDERASWKLELSSNSKAPTKPEKARGTSGGRSAGAPESLSPLLKMPGKILAPEFTFRAGNTSSGSPRVKIESGISPPQGLMGLDSPPATPPAHRGTSNTKETSVSRGPRREVMKRL